MPTVKITVDGEELEIGLELLTRGRAKQFAQSVLKEMGGRTCRKFVLSEDGTSSSKEREPVTFHDTEGPDTDSQTYVALLYRGFLNTEIIALDDHTYYALLGYGRQEEHRALILLTVHPQKESALVVYRTD